MHVCAHTCGHIHTHPFFYAVSSLSFSLAQVQASSLCQTSNTYVIHILPDPGLQSFSISPLSQITMLSPYDQPHLYPLHTPSLPTVSMAADPLRG